MRLGRLGSIVGAVLLAAGAASAQRLRPGLANAAQQTARAPNGRFSLLRPTQRVLRRPVGARGMRSGGAYVGASEVTVSYRPATARAPGQLHASVPDYYRGSSVAAHDEPRMLSVTDVQGVAHTIPMTIHVSQGARTSAYSPAQISVDVPRGVTVSQEGLRDALMRSSVMTSGEIHATPTH